MDEPVAAARHWLSSIDIRDVPDHVIVCDAGGGTTDFAILRKTQLGFEAFPECPPMGVALGGIYIDEIIMDTVLSLCSKENKELLENQSSGWVVKFRCLKEWLTKCKKLSFTVTLGQQQMDIPTEVIKDATGKLVNEIQNKLKDFIEKCEKVTIKNDVPVILVGGASRLTGLIEAIKSVSSGKVYLWNDSDYATVLGAAIEIQDEAVLQKPLPNKYSVNNSNILELQTVCEKIICEFNAVGEESNERFLTGISTFDFDKIKMASSLGISAGQFLFGLFYFYGVKCERQHLESEKLFTLSADQDNVNAMLWLAGLYFMDGEVRKDINKAVSLCERAAIKGEANAQYLLGGLYRDGIGVVQNPGKAADFFAKATEQGHIEAQLSLGLLFKNGIGVHQDYDKATELFKQLAEKLKKDAIKEIPKSLYNLGKLYQEGLGVPQNNTTAIELINKAAKLGHATAQAEIDEFYALITKSEGLFIGGIGTIKMNAAILFNQLDEYEQHVSEIISENKRDVHLLQSTPKSIKNAIEKSNDSVCEASMISIREKLKKATMTSYDDDNPCACVAHYGLSLISVMFNEKQKAAIHLLSMFSASPRLARVIAPKFYANFFEGYMSDIVAIRNNATSKIPNDDDSFRYAVGAAKIVAGVTLGLLFTPAAAVVAAGAWKDFSKKGNSKGQAALDIIEEDFEENVDLRCRTLANDFLSALTN